MRGIFRSVMRIGDRRPGARPRGRPPPPRGPSPGTPRAPGRVRSRSRIWGSSSTTRMWGGLSPLGNGGPHIRWIGPRRPDLRPVRRSASASPRIGPPRPSRRSEPAAVGRATTATGPSAGWARRVSSWFQITWRSSARNVRFSSRSTPRPWNAISTNRPARTARRCEAPQALTLVPRQAVDADPQRQRAQRGSRREDLHADVHRVADVAGSNGERGPPRAEGLDDAYELAGLGDGDRVADRAAEPPLHGSRRGELREPLEDQHDVGHAPDLRHQRLPGRLRDRRVVGQQAQHLQRVVHRVGDLAGQHAHRLPALASEVQHLRGRRRRGSARGRPAPRGGRARAGTRPRPRRSARRACSLPPLGHEQDDPARRRAASHRVQEGRVPSPEVRQREQHEVGRRAPRSARCPRRARRRSRTRYPRPFSVCAADRRPGPGGATRRTVRSGRHGAAPDADADRPMRHHAWNRGLSPRRPDRRPVPPTMSISLNELEPHEATLRILLADDERAIAITLADDLKRAGHEVRVASDGDEARAALAQRVASTSSSPTSGCRWSRAWSSCEDVKSRGADTEVIIITGLRHDRLRGRRHPQGRLRLHPQALRQRRDPRRAPQDRGDPPPPRRERRAARDPGPREGPRADHRAQPGHAARARSHPHRGRLATRAC